VGGGAADLAAGSGGLRSVSFGCEPACDERLRVVVGVGVGQVLEVRQLHTVAHDRGGERIGVRGRPLACESNRQQPQRRGCSVVAAAVSRLRLRLAVRCTHCMRMHCTRRGRFPVPCSLFLVTYCSAFLLRGSASRVGFERGLCMWEHRVVKAWGYLCPPVHIDIAPAFIVFAAFGTIFWPVLALEL